MMQKVLLKPEKEIEGPVQRNRIFQTAYKTKDRVCKVIMDSGSTDNLVLTEMVEKLELEKIEHPSPYRVSWLQKGHQVNVTKKCLVEFKIGGYNDKILCDVIPMDVCHLLLGRPWQYDRNVIHDGRKNTYTLEKNGRTHMLSIKDKEVKIEINNTVLLMSGKELLDEVKKKESGEAHITEAQGGDAENEDADSGRSLGMHKILLTPEKEVEDLAQRTKLFRTACKTKDRVCKVIVDSGSMDNLVSIEMVEKLELEKTDHPSPYKVSWLQKGH